ncbi:MAG: transposase [Opitutaceae bacterium]
MCASSQPRRVKDNPPYLEASFPNAPLQLPIRERLFHTPPPWTKTGEVFFITICCAERKTNQLNRSEVFAVMVDSIEHYARNGKWWPQLFLAMPDHLHALISFPPETRMEKIVRDWKRYIAKNTPVRWQDGFFDHRIRDDKSLQEKAAYIRMNPIRAGLVSHRNEWRYIWPAGVASETAR